jgi:Xaa-Pro aminopeptidase
MRGSSDMGSPPDKTADLISDPSNITYLTGFIGADPAGHEAYILKTGATWYFFTNSLYIERVRELQKSQPHLIPMQISRDKPLGTEVARVIRSQGITTLAVEDYALSFGEYRMLSAALPGIPIVPTNAYTGIRTLKRADEIEKIRAACQLTDACYNYITALIKPGITETRLAKKIVVYLYENDAVPAFDPIVAFDTHASQPHYIPDQDSFLTKDSSILLDFGAKVNGYCADMTRMVYLQPPESRIRTAYDAVLAAQEQALHLIAQRDPSIYVPGADSFSGAKLDTATKESIANAGFEPYSHGLGHGLGLEIHENPRLSAKIDTQIKPGTTFTVEPGVYVPGEFGIRIEDTVYMGNTGLEILTKTAKEIRIIS